MFSVEGIFLQETVKKLLAWNRDIQVWTDNILNLFRAFDIRDAKIFICPVQEIFTNELPHPAHFNSFHWRKNQTGSGLTQCPFRYK